MSVYHLGYKYIRHSIDQPKQIILLLAFPISQECAMSSDIRWTRLDCDLPARLRNLTAEWSVELLTNWFQIFLICGYLID